MYLKRIAVRNFGPIRSWEAELPPTGINLAIGPNGSGKTQLIAAIVAALAGPPGRLLQLYANGEPTIVRLTLADDVAEAELGFESNGRSLDWAIPAVEGARLQRALLGMLSEGTGLSLVLSGELLDDDSLPFMVEELRESPRLAELAPEGLRDIVLAGDLADLSRGARSLLTLLHEVLRRLDASNPPPWLLDCPLSRFNLEDQRLAAAWLRRVAQHQQVILLDTGTQRSLDPDGLAVHSLPALDGGIGLTRAAVASRHLNHRLLAREAQVSGLVGRIAAQHIPLSTTLSSSLAGQHTNAMQFATQLDAIATNLREVLLRKSKVLQAVETMRQDYSDQLEDALRRKDDALVEKICAEFSDALSRLLRRTMAAQLDEGLAALAATLGPAWDRLSRITQKDLAIAWRLGQDMPDEGIHLAILQLCRVIESEVHHNIFTPYRHHAERTLPQHEVSASEAWQVEPKFRRTLDEFCRFLRGSGPRLTLATFSWILKAAERHPEIPVFQNFNSWLEATYASRTKNVRALVIGLAMPADTRLEELPEPLATIRNACAHPDSTGGPNALSRGTYQSIWKIALNPPVQMLVTLLP